MLYIYPYNSKSESAATIAKALNVKRLKRTNSKVVDSPDITIINWGAAAIPFTRARIINPVRSVATAANKLRFFRKCEENKGINIPPFTTSFDTVREWLKKEHFVCSRAVLDGNSGEGLVISNQESDLPTNSPLYTQYLPKAAEYRVHVVNGGVIRVQRKVFPQTKDKTGVDWKIRNHDNGFIFQIANVREIPQAVLEQAVLACSHVGLDFGGVDVIWNNKNQLASVLEINTAPGIEGGTVDLYADAFNQMRRLRHF